MPADRTPAPAAAAQGESRRSPSTRLTGRGAGLLLMSLAAVVIGALVAEPNAVRAGLFGMLLVPLTWPFARLNLTKLRLSRRLPPDCFAGQLFATDLRLTNESTRFPRFGIELDDTMAGPTERGLSAGCIAPGATVLRTLTTRMLRRGVRHRLRCSLTSSFPLGLWRSRRELRDVVDFTVFPRPVPPRSLDDATDPSATDVDEAESGHRDWAGDLHGVRAFQPGDRLKLIHWPGTARTGSLVVRVFDRPLPEQYFVVFHSICPGRHQGERADAFEGAMELLAGLLVHCRERAIPLDFVASFNDWRLLHIRSPMDMEDALHLLAAARRRGEQDVSQLLHAIAGIDVHTRVFLLSDVPVKDWEPLLPELPFEITCLSVADLRIRRPGRLYRLSGNVVEAFPS